LEPALDASLWMRVFGRREIIIPLAQFHSEG
jgi:hypothetical protein